MEQKKKVPVLTIRDLSITFRTTAGPVNAIRGVNIDLMRGETLAIVGESGSGKSVTFKAVMGILAKNSEVNSGSIKYSYFHDDGSPAEVDILKMKKGEIRRHINGKRIAMILSLIHIFFNVYLNGGHFSLFVILSMTHFTNLAG